MRHMDVSNLPANLKIFKLNFQSLKETISIVSTVAEIEVGQRFPMRKIWKNRPDRKSSHANESQ